MGQVIKKGDYVQIITPETVIRVGYDFTHEQACEEVKTTYKEDIWVLMRKAGVINNKIVEKKIVSAIAFGLVQKKVKTGNVRKVYTELKEEYKDRIVKVIGKRTAMTGIYFPGCSGSAPYYEDAEPGGLKDPKTHVILELGMINTLTLRPVEIEVTNVIKVNHGHK